MKGAIIAGILFLALGVVSAKKCYQCTYWPGGHHGGGMMGNMKGDMGTMDGTGGDTTGDSDVKGMKGEDMEDDDTKGDTKGDMKGDMGDMMDDEAMQEMQDMLSSAVMDGMQEWPEVYHEGCAKKFMNEGDNMVSEVECPEEAFCFAQAFGHDDDDKKSGAWFRGCATTCEEGDDKWCCTGELCNGAPQLLSGPVMMLAIVVMAAFY